MKFKINKKFLNKANLGLTVVIVIGILAVLNFFSYQIFYRWDLTANKDYSISKASKKTSEDLDDVVNIRAYFTENLPSQYINLRQEVRDILDEYANYSGGKVRVEFIDPKDNEELQRELYLSGIPELQFNVLEKDKYQVVKGYLGMVIQYGDKKEAIPVVQSTENLEYQITLAIKKVTNKVDAKVGLVTSNKTASLDSDISEAHKKLAELYQVREIDLKKEKNIDKEIKTLIIIGPTEKFEENELKMLDRFLMQGGSLLFLVDGVKIEEGLRAQANEVGLDKLLESYGIKLSHDLIADIYSGVASFSQGFVTFSTNYPLWPKVVKEGFDQNNAAVAKLESLVLPWASSVEILSDKIDKENQVWHLAKTTNKASRQTDSYDLNPEGNFFSGSQRGQYDLAAAIFGKFKSAYEQDLNGKGRLIVVGDSDFIKDRFTRGIPDNLLFFQNLVDSLSLDEDLINIRSKGVSERPIKEIGDTAKMAIRYGNIFGLTVIVVAFGLVRYFMRKRRIYQE